MITTTTVQAMKLTGCAISALGFAADIASWLVIEGIAVMRAKRAVRASRGVCPENADAP